MRMKNFEPENTSALCTTREADVKRIKFSIVCDEMSAVINIVGYFRGMMSSLILIINFRGINDSR